MCGIAGYLSANADGTHPGDTLDRAVELLHHRGPDDGGVWRDTTAGIGLGHRRLSVLDLSECGHQPMHSADGSHTIVFNGEIYNFRDIRRELESVGDRFRGSGDTEVILAAFRRWGVDAVHRFIGMFAIAVWDAGQQRLTLIRDRVGVKPLYYAWQGGRLVFGSELKAVLALLPNRPTIDRTAMGEYFHYGYISGDRCIFEGIHKLPSAHKLTLSRGGEPTVTRYWSVSPAGATCNGHAADAEEELEALLFDAFRLRMVSDVPVGVFLSGGVDSSLVAALLSRGASPALRTFTIGFADDANDESPWAQKVAAHLGTDHTEYILDAREALGIASNWGDLFDEPFSDTSGIPTFLVSKLAREQVTVALSADGGDELFGGYRIYDTVLRHMRRLERMPGALRWIGAAVARDPAPEFAHRLLATLGVPAARCGHVTRRLRRAASVLPDITSGRAFDAAIALAVPSEVRALCGTYASPRTTADAHSGSYLQQMCAWDFDHYLPEDVLTKVDRATMAVSLEGREPLLDHRIAEFAFRQADAARHGPAGSKHLLKQILYRHVPATLVDRPKQGFAVPLDTWLRGDLAPLARDLLSEGRVRATGHLNPREVSRIVRRFYAGDALLARQVWSLLAFELWRQRWEGAGAAQR